MLSDLSYLSYPLPPDVQRLFEAGELARMERVIGLRLADSRTPECLKERLRFQLVIARDLPEAYPFTQTELLGRLRAAVRDFGDEELEIVRNTMMASVAAMFDSPFSMMDFRMRRDLLGSDIPDIERRMAVISSVTPADVMRMVRTYLLDAPRYVATAGGAASEGGAETDVERR